MALKLDPFVQRKLLDLAAADRTINTARHRRGTLPELATIAETTTAVGRARQDVVVAETEVADLERATDKLDGEVEQVKARARRDADRLASGSATPKELEGLQHEIESLKRRQTTLEDQELELMEQRESAERTLESARRTLADLEARAGVAVESRDREWAGLDSQLEAELARRAEITAALPADVLALYDRIRDSGRVAAGELVGGRCGACRLEIDRTALAEIKAAPIEAIVRCTECGAILVRS